MNVIKEANFPEAEAWAASMPDLRSGFSASSPRKEVMVATVAPDVEYNNFAKLDLSNM